MLPSARRNSLKRFGPPPSVSTTSTVHLSPTRDSTALMARHSVGSCSAAPRVRAAGTVLCPGISGVPSCLVRAVIYLGLVIFRN
jgi:hypothetical protein